MLFPVVESLAPKNTLLRSKIMNLKSTLFKGTFGLIVTICALGALIFWLSDPLNLKSPKDEELFTTFHGHREAFEKLRIIAIEDSRHQSYFSESNLEGKFNDLRKQEYRNLLSEIHPGLIVTVDKDQVV